MPIYEYQCTACKKELEVLQKISDALLTQCPECGREALRKKISAAGFRLKGGGWYETDFKSDKRKNLAGDGAKESAGKSESNSGGQDSGSSTSKSDSGNSATA